MPQFSKEKGMGAGLVYRELNTAPDAVNAWEIHLLKLHMCGI